MLPFHLPSASMAACRTAGSSPTGLSRAAGSPNEVVRHEPYRRPRRRARPRRMRGEAAAVVAFLLGARRLALCWVGGEDCSNVAEGFVALGPVAFKRCGSKLSSQKNDPT